MCYLYFRGDVVSGWPYLHTMIWNALPAGIDMFARFLSGVPMNWTAVVILVLASIAGIFLLTRRTA